jgi:hypothetical protein
VHLLADLACAQDDVEEQYADTESQEELKDTILARSYTSAEEDDEDLEWHHKLPSDKADVHQFVREQNGLNKATAPIFLKIYNHLISFCYIIRPS